MFCVALSIDPFVLFVARLTVFVNCLVKQFAVCLGVFLILLLNVMELLAWFPRYQPDKIPGLFPDFSRTIIIFFRTKFPTLLKFYVYFCIHHPTDMIRPKFKCLLK